MRTIPVETRNGTPKSTIFNIHAKNISPTDFCIFHRHLCLTCSLRLIYNGDVFGEI